MAKNGRHQTFEAPSDESWRDLAACRDSDPDLFFPISETREFRDQIEAAKAICDLCIVRGECLDYALQTNQQFGIWGGFTEDERRGMKSSKLARKFV